MKIPVIFLGLLAWVQAKPHPNADPLAKYIFKRQIPVQDKGGQMVVLANSGEAVQASSVIFAGLDQHQAQQVLVLQPDGQLVPYQDEVHDQQYHLTGYQGHYEQEQPNYVKVDLHGHQDQVQYAHHQQQQASSYAETKYVKPVHHQQHQHHVPQPASQYHPQYLPKPPKPYPHQPYKSLGYHSGPPKCAKNGKKYCLDDYDYPKYAIEEAIIENYEAVTEMYKDVFLTTENSVKNLTELEQESYVCPSDIQYAKPLRAVNAFGKWRVIVNNVKAAYETLTQYARLETCNNPGEACPNVPGPYGADCLQKAAYHRFLVYDPYDEELPFAMDSFKLPSACFCYAPEWLDLRKK